MARRAGAHVGSSKDARRTIPPAVVAAGVIITVLYTTGTLSILLAIPKQQISGLQGIMRAMRAMATKGGFPGSRRSSRCSSPSMCSGGVGGWFAATARLPFVAGLDRFLPRAFGDLHPRRRTPYVALLTQGALHRSGAGRHDGARRL